MRWLSNELNKSESTRLFDFACLFATFHHQLIVPNSINSRLAIFKRVKLILRSIQFKNMLSLI